MGKPSCSHWSCLWLSTHRLFNSFFFFFLFFFFFFPPWFTPAIPVWMKPYYWNFSYSFCVKITVNGVEEWLWLWPTYPHPGWTEHLILQMRPAVDMKTRGLCATGLCTLKNPRQLGEILAIFQKKFCQHWELIRPCVVTCRGGLFWGKAGQNFLTGR